MAVLAELKRKGKVYDVLGKCNLHIFDRHHMLKNIFWSMHDACLVFNIKELAIMTECITEEMLSTNPPMKLRDNLPVIACNS